MSMSKNIARLAVTAGLTAALSFGGVMAPVTMAFAEDGSTVTFEDADYAASTTYKGIQIFKAKVTATNGTTTVSGIEWAGTGTEIQTAVVNAIQEKEPTYTSTNAQNAADWLNEHNKDADATDSTTMVSSDHVLNKIAANLKDSSGWKTTNVGDASINGLGAGYWLFLTNTLGTPEGKTTDTFTSPVFAVIDGVNSKTIIPKKSVPTVDKKILSAKGDEELDASDSHVGQDVTYNLYGTIADNYDTYSAYSYQFSDQLSKGLTLQNGYAVYLYKNIIDARQDLGRTHPVKNITNDFQETRGAEAEDGSVTTTWACSNLKNEDSVIAGSCIVVSYKAKINSKAAIGGNAGNTNTATLTYSNNPMTNGSGTTVPDEVKSYTYGLKLNKVDLGTEEALKDSNIKFTIKVKSTADSNLVGKYVKSDGTLVESECKLSATNGAITIKGLGAGTYTVVETDAPANYDKVEPFDFTITPNRGSEASGENPVGAKYEIETSQKDMVIIGTPNDTRGDNKLEAKTNTTTNDDGTFNITVGDTKQVGLPLTGLNGVTFTWIAGGAVLCIGVAHLIRSRKQAEESEQE